MTLGGSRAAFGIASDWALALYGCRYALDVESGACSLQDEREGCCSDDVMWCVREV